MAVLLKFPFAIIERTHLAGFQPSANAVKVEGMIAYSPSNCALLAGRTSLISLTFNAKIHDVVPANRTVIHHDIPGPERNGVPLLDFKSFGFLGGSRR